MKKVFIITLLLITSFVFSESDTYLLKDYKEMEIKEQVYYLKGVSVGLEAGKEIVRFLESDIQKNKDIDPEDRFERLSLAFRAMSLVEDSTKGTAAYLGYMLQYVDSEEYITASEAIKDLIIEAGMGK